MTVYIDGDGDYIDDDLEPYPPVSYTNTLCYPDPHQDHRVWMVWLSFTFYSPELFKVRIAETPQIILPPALRVGDTVSRAGYTVDRSKTTIPLDTIEGEYAITDGVESSRETYHTDLLGAITLTYRSLTEEKHERMLHALRYSIQNVQSAVTRDIPHWESYLYFTELLSTNMVEFQEYLNMTVNSSEENFYGDSLYEK